MVGEVLSEIRFISRPPPPEPPEPPEPPAPPSYVHEIEPTTKRKRTCMLRVGCFVSEL